MLAIVRYNTVVHPFTLADNRHYMFYVFRLLTRWKLSKYLAVPVYFGAAWIVFAALGENPDFTADIADKRTSKKDDNVTHKEASPVSQIEIEVPNISWVAIWFGTTALSLCTAPLVEPRYCIVPWMIWRLHLPMTGS